MTYEHTSRTICFTLIFENLLHPFLDLLEKIYLSYVHWNIVGGPSDTPPVPYVSSGFGTSFRPTFRVNSVQTKQDDPYQGGMSYHIKKIAANAICI